ncbi:hypothetical protein BHE96_07885 [Bacillus subtilis]|nr:hypothetical protein BHE96_07885 [Bacillus subtilis]
MKAKHFCWVFIILILLIAVTFIKLPYYITQPGEASELRPLIKVDGGYPEKGSLSLMTVKVGPANPYTYLWAKVHPYEEIVPDESIKEEGESDSDYMKRQLQMMKSSQENAVIAAYQKAGKQVKYSFNGIYASSVVSDMPAKGKIEVGDKIISADGKTYESAEKLIDYISSKKAGGKVTFHIERDTKEKTVDIVLKSFPDDPKRAGIGVALYTDRNVKVKPDLHFSIENIGGPSAGLMMSLEIYNQLTKPDETKGYNIAGTGTIDVDGKVGPIGGIDQKVVAADKAGKDIFFAPNQNGAENSDYKNAVKTAKAIKSDMKIVPVDTMQDALDYLDQLKVKST